MDLNAAMIFVKVVRLGSFTKAAKDLNLPPSTVSDRIIELERMLGVKLLVRTTRKLRLTDAGSIFFKKSEVAVADLLSAGEAASVFQKKPSGILRITAPADFDFASICEAMLEYSEKFPDVKIDLQLTDRIVDMITEGFDIAIRASHVQDSSLTAKRLNASGHILVASKKYLQKHPPILNPNDLLNQQCLMISSKPETEKHIWNLISSSGKKLKLSPQGHITSNSTSFIKHLVKIGEGIALMPPTLVHVDIAKGSLIHILPEWATPSHSGFLVYTARHDSSPKVREMIPLLEPRLRKVIK